MMRLPNDVSRCMGELAGDERGRTKDVKDIFCPRRDTCARYVQRNTGGERTPYTSMICHDGLDAYIRQEGKDDQRDA
jgi:hypothetical protein